jgi:predicted kinase
MGKVIILQGVPGSGKSTYQRQFYPDAEVFSADHYFTAGGQYDFNPKMLPHAHGMCLRGFINWCKSNSMLSKNVAIVDNTNTTVTEIAPYMAVAAAYNHDAEIFAMMVAPEIAAKRNIHGVSQGAVEGMAQRIVASHKQLPPWWKLTVFTES